MEASLGNMERASYGHCNHLGICQAYLPYVSFVGLCVTNVINVINVIVRKQSNLLEALLYG